MEKFTDDLLKSLNPLDFLCPSKELQESLASYANHLLSEESSAPTLKQNDNIDQVTDAWCQLEADRNFIEVAVAILAKIQATKKIDSIKLSDEGDGVENGDNDDQISEDGEDEEIDLRDYDEDDDERSRLAMKQFEKKATLYQENLAREKERISKLEKELVEPKDWQLKGEATADIRPVNSLLEEHLQFDFVSREAPLITQVTTATIEDKIRERIKANQFDDVERKVKPSEQPFEYKRRLVLEHEKSKASLAQVYEDEYLKKVQSKEGFAPDDKNPVHEEIRKMAKSLFYKLASLSSFHYTPPVPEPELKIINNLPAITVEEAIPEAVSDATLLAPEEIVAKKRRETLQAGEKTDTDRKRERRVKKKIQKVRAHHQASKKDPSSNSSMPSKYSKLHKARELDGKAPIKSSKSFFQMLDDQVKADLSADKSKNLKKKPSQVDSGISGKKFKL